MRVMIAAIALVLVVAFPLTGCAKKTEPNQPVQAPVASAPVAKNTTPTVAGNQGALAAALAEPSRVRYEIVVSDSPAEVDKDAELDSLLKQRNWPEAPTMVLMLFPKANHDLRFAMGADFNQKKVGIDEVLAMVRSFYFPKAKAGDPASGLADLVRSINQRMTQ